jgi:hypothetical protein
MVSVDDGSAFTGTVTVYITGDGGTQAIGTVGSGVCTHEGNGLHTYQPSQAETNYTHIAFTFVGSGAVPVTIQVHTNVDTQLLDIQSRLPATLDSGNMRSSVQAMAPNTLTASALAADAVADIQSGLATSTGVTAAFTEIKGAGWSSATGTLENIAESAGGGTVTVAPLSSLAPERVNGTTISVAVGDVSPVSIDVYDANGVAIDLTAQGNLEVCIESRNNVDLQVVAHASITISGTGNRKATWTPNAAAVGTVDKQRWSLRTASGKRVLAYGPWVVERVALNDA